MGASVAVSGAKPNGSAEGAAVAWHALPAEAVLSELGVSEAGLATAEANRRRARFGPNRLPRPHPPGVLRLYLRQFKKPLVYLLLLAILAGLPVPLFAAQLLWLNLVTNGIQDVALAFEKGEPGS